MSNTIPKVGIITQARVGSSRLPGKTLKTILGKSLLQLHFERLLMAKIPIYLATTPEQDAEKLIDIASTCGISSTIGPLDDVLTRFYICAVKNSLDIIIRVTSDCPLIDGKMIHDALQTYLSFPNWNIIYFSNTIQRRMPRGLDFEIFSFSLLREAHLGGLSMSEREHVTPFIYLNSNSRAQIKSYDSAQFNSDYSELRITVDTVEDFELISQLVTTYNASSLDAKQLVDVLLANPDLILINHNIVQKKLPDRI